MQIVLLDLLLIIKKGIIYEKKKQKAFNEIRTTNHWPHKPKLFGKTPRTYGNELPLITSIEPPLLSELGMKLAGF